jgi:signal transduction histidine kinase
MKTWADNCPTHFLHKYLLVKAEIASLNGKDLEAMDLYDSAIESARENKYIQNEALANELAAKFWLKRGKTEIAQLYLKKAHSRYQQWGAKRKLDDLEAKYPQLLAQKHSDRLHTTNGCLNRNSPLDFNTVMKASQSLSEEIVLSRLLEKMMQIVIENVGAETGFLLLPQHDEWFIEAESHLNSHEIKVLQSIPLENHPPLAASIIRYIARTQTPLVLNNATIEGNFTRDPHIVKHQTQSILCTPLKSRGQLIGILYLENKLIPSAFTPDRLEVVKLLSAQIVISIENARLYAQLEDKVAERTQELSQTVEHLKATQDELVQSEKMAALGKLIAGVAHEINTPLGAIRSSVGNIADFLNSTLAQLPAFFKQLSQARQHYFLNLVQKASQIDMTLSIREKRRLKNALISELEKHAIENADTIAMSLIGIGIYEDVTPFLPLLKDADSQAILENAYQLASLRKSVQAIKIASDRASKVVFALKNFARFDASGEKVQANITEGIETVLTLYHNQFKQGVLVKKHFAQLPPMWCYPDDLNQVWINLIHNALQAMDYKGTLTIEVLQQSEQVRVSITDSGKGIPPEIQPKIFEPFFTTKPAGEGNGLGLDIVRRIIDKHEGKIDVESTQGKTTFTVSLPLY